MRRVGVRSGEQFVEAMFRLVERNWRDLQSRAAESWGSHGDEQRGGGFPSSRQILESLANQVSARERLDVHTARNYTAEPGRRARSRIRPSVENVRPRGPAQPLPGARPLAIRADVGPMT